ncbi:hypothetical protein ACVMIX_004339 [Rhizobium leguminosarum]
MAKTNFLSWDTTAGNNQDIDGISILGSANVNNFDNAFRTLMAQLRAGVDGEVVYASKSGNYTALANDNNAVHRYTATATITLTAAATLGANWHYTVVADGAAVTIDPNASETINGATTLIVPNGASVEIICDGSNFFAQRKTPSVMTLEAAAISSVATKDINLTTYIAAGYTEFELVLSDLKAATDGQSLIMVVSVDGGASWLSSSYSTVFQTTVASTGSTGAAGGANGINFTLGTLHGNAAGETDNIKCDIAISASSVSVNCEGNYWLSTTDDFLMLKHTGRHNTAGINAIRLLYGSGNITSGTYILRGKRGAV